MEPATKRGLPGVENPSATSRAMRALASDSSSARSAIWYSARVWGSEPNVLVSTMSAPTSKYAVCRAATTSGRVTASSSGQPSYCSPP